MHPRYYLGGGIGAGKSVAGEILASLGAVVISGDAAGREVLAPGTPETAAVLARWPAVGLTDGRIDRRALGAIVFAAPDQLRELETITAPGIRRRLTARVDAAPTDAVVLVEVPVLREFAGESWPWIVVDAPDDLRVSRVVSRGSGMGAEEVRHVMARQPSRGEWLAAAEWVIDNSGDRDHLADQCRRVWEAIARP